MPGPILIVCTFTKLLIDFKESAASISRVQLHIDKRLARIVMNDTNAECFSAPDEGDDHRIA